MPDPPIIYEAVDAKLELTAFKTYEAVVDVVALPLKLPVIPCVTIRDPLNIAGPIFVNVDEPEIVSDPVIIALPLNGNGEIYPSKYEAVKAYDEVPFNVPVKDPVKDPVL